MLLKHLICLSLDKNIVGKEKMLVSSIFSFSHNVYKRPHLRDAKSRLSVVKS